MLTLRSKILITAATAVIVGIVISYATSSEFWRAEPDAEDWYLGWIILVVMILLAVASIVIDVRRNRMSS